MKRKTIKLLILRNQLVEIEPIEKKSFILNILKTSKIDLSIFKERTFKRIDYSEGLMSKKIIFSLKRYSDFQKKIKKICSDTGVLLEVNENDLDVGFGFGVGHLAFPNGRTGTGKTFLQHEFSNMKGYVFPDFEEEADIDGLKKIILNRFRGNKIILDGKKEQVNNPYLAKYFIIDEAHMVLKRDEKIHSISYDSLINSLRDSLFVQKIKSKKLSESQKAFLLKIREFKNKKMAFLDKYKKPKKGE